MNPRIEFPAKSRPSMRTNTFNLSSSISPVISVKLKDETSSNLRPSISLPTNSIGSIPSLNRSPVNSSSTHQINCNDSVSIPPSSEITILTSCNSESSIASILGARTSTGIGPSPSTTIQRTDEPLSVASIPCSGIHPTDHVNGIVPEFPGVVRGMFQIP